MAVTTLNPMDIAGYIARYSPKDMSRFLFSLALYIVYNRLYTESWALFSFKLEFYFFKKEGYLFLYQVREKLAQEPWCDQICEFEVQNED